MPGGGLLIGGEVMEGLCRCCGGEIKGKPILYYKNMPKAAQFFPTEEELEKEKGIDLKLYQCSRCGLIQLIDEPVSYYRDVIRTAGLSEELQEYRKDFFRKFVEKYELQGKKIIEIGAGCGEFLSIMDTTGAVCYGLEHLESSVEECRRKGLEVYQGFVESETIQLEHAPYDGFFIMNFLEHIPSPIVFLTGIANNLTDKGIGLIEVPNMDMVLEKMMFSEFISDHLMYFTEKSLRNLLEISGFEVISCERVWHDYVLSAVVRKRKGIQLDDFWEQMEKIKKEVNGFLDYHMAEGKKAAVWGAGHQALAVLALADLKEKVSFVVDSAPFKQNKYTPGTHIPIVSPEFLEEHQEETDVVLVVAASYSDEVAGIIQRKYADIAVGILRDYGVEIL